MFGYEIDVSSQVLLGVVMYYIPHEGIRNRHTLSLSLCQANVANVVYLVFDYCMEGWGMRVMMVQYDNDMNSMVVWWTLFQFASEL